MGDGGAVLKNGIAAGAGGEGEVGKEGHGPVGGPGDLGGGFQNLQSGAEGDVGGVFTDNGVLHRKGLAVQCEGDGGGGGGEKGTGQSEGSKGAGQGIHGDTPSENGFVWTLCNKIVTEGGGGCKAQCFPWKEMGKGVCTAADGGGESGAWIT